jgi:hypothetical protein
MKTYIIIVLLIIIWCLLCNKCENFSTDAEVGKAIMSFCELQHYGPEECCRNKLQHDAFVEGKIKEPSFVKFIEAVNPDLLK